MSLHTEDASKPKVLIVGGGLAGLLLATLFESIHIPYHVFERATEVRPLGSVMGLGPNILPVFEQLCLLEEIEKISLPSAEMHVFNASMKKLGTMGMNGLKAATGYDNLMFARPRLYEVLRKQVPAHKISMGKKVLRTEEKDNKVIIHCADNSTYDGDILVGADGAYSGVRQSLYKQLDQRDLLPKEDLENFSIGYVSMVGVATPKDSEKYPQLSDQHARFSKVLGGDSRGWGVFNVADKQACWALSIQLNPEEARVQQFRNSEWGPESNEVMIKEFQDYPCPWGGTMGELIEATPKKLISKVFIEEKLFKTWYHGRTVLIGDGAVNAMQDAVVLANCLFNMPDTTTASLTAAFEEYVRQRYHRADAQIQRSKTMGKITAGQTWTERFIRYVMLNYMPEWVQQRSLAKTFEYRPQVAWLPLVENRGAGYVLPQESPRRVIEDNGDTPTTQVV
ncbi:hypothetical protein EDD11_004325 [Mortierella claussenii]|nr:hypothetical protein EDD11_004325 [Mortierella claussenii]